VPPKFQAGVDEPKELRRVHMEGDEMGEVEGEATPGDDGQAPGRDRKVRPLPEPIRRADGHVEDFEPVTRALGSRNAYVRNVVALVKETGDWFQEQLGAPENRQKYLDSIMAGVETGEKTAMLLYAKVMKLYEKNDRYQIQIFNTLNVKDATEASKLIERARGAAKLSPREKAEKCVSFLEAFIDTEPKQRMWILRRLGGEVAETSEVLR